MAPDTAAPQPSEPTRAVTDTAASDGITTHADDERRRLGIPRTRETPCAVDGCDVTSPLHRVNPKGDLGIFMCPEHARRIG